MSRKLKQMTFAAAVAAIYAVLTLMPGLTLLSFGPYQFRISEVLTIMPLYSPYGIAGVTLGCLIANIFSPIGLPDIILGTLATLLAAYTTYRLRNKNRIVSLAPPVIFNAVIIGLMIAVFYMNPGEVFWEVAAFNIFSVGVGQAGVLYLLGLPLSKLLDKHPFRKQI